jgi:hypothetical protein
VRRLLPLFVFLLAGCAGGGGGASIERGELRSIVLQPSDLPSVFQRFDEGRQGRAEQPGGLRGDPARFGRVEGWKARYRRPGSARTSGPLVIESRVDLFGDSDGATEELDTLESGVDMRLLAQAPDLGDDAFAATVRQPSGVPGASGVRFYLVAWRQGNVTASVSVNGFEGRLELDDALALARKQQQRIESAAA